MAASLPDCTIIPCRRSGTDAGLPAGRKVRDPSAAAATAETVTGRVGSSLPSRKASNTTYAVISLVSEAGSKRSFSFAAESVWPLSKSTTM